MGRRKGDPQPMYPLLGTDYPFAYALGGDESFYDADPEEIEELFGCEEE